MLTWTDPRISSAQTLDALPEMIAAASSVTDWAGLAAQANGESAHGFEHGGCSGHYWNTETVSGIITLSASAQSTGVCGLKCSSITLEACVVAVSGLALASSLSSSSRSPGGSSLSSACCGVSICDLGIGRRVKLPWLSVNRKCA
jgi:hypothetical protein